MRWGDGLMAAEYPNCGADNSETAKKSWHDSLSGSRRRALILGLSSMAIIIILLYVILSQPVSTVLIQAMTGPDYGSGQLTIYLDGIEKAQTNISPATGAFSISCSVTPGGHTVKAHWIGLIGGTIDEEKSFSVLPFSQAVVRFSHGAGWA